MIKPLIVGVDMGTTTGLAIYDLEKNLLLTCSRKNFSINSIIKEIMNFGEALVVATDKKKVSPSIKKIAASFNCKIYSPDHDITVEEKRGILSIDIKDVHERDALSAAAFAYRQYEGMFNSISRALSAMHLGQYKDHAKKMIVTGEAKNIAEAIDMIKPKEDPKIKTEFKEVNLDWKNVAKKHKKTLKRLEHKYEISRLYSEKMEDRVKTLERQKKIYLEEESRKNENARKELLKDKEIRKLHIVIKQLQFELSKQKKLKLTYEDRIRRQDEVIEIQNEGLVAVVLIPDFSNDTVSRSVSEFDVTNKVVWIKDYMPLKTSARILAKKKPKIVIAEMDDKMRAFLKKSGIMVIDSVEPEMRNYYGAISPKELESTMKKVEKRDFKKWLVEYKKR
ncbi:MAG: DUF460 domain-containing protein [Candidatus Aenigmarchaeota archaeon]|nr:DUF460 domain-containing protein [Candidatus Aenigmarchaeota archaeon]